MVARQQAAPRELPQLDLSLTLQVLRDLLRDHLPAEHAREAIADHAFELALEALHEAHDNPLHAYDSGTHRIWVNGAGHRPVPNSCHPR
ncbi:hypothetical protein GCM10020366_59740 [Saccharopolyspora gregorii]|uniref:Uncharacterized protein n=1 Tax=Saccharopolyspora gregorii TaxID=33914 RepID=A0ABP6RZR4_9PSEU